MCSSNADNTSLLRTEGKHSYQIKRRRPAGYLLFNGKDFTGWRQCNGTAMPKNWVIEEDAMKVFTGEGKKPGSGSDGDIVFGEQEI